MPVLFMGSAYFGASTDMRVIMIMIIVTMVAGIMSLRLVPGSDEQVPPGKPLERALNPANDIY